MSKKAKSRIRTKPVRIRKASMAEARAGLIPSEETDASRAVTLEMTYREYDTVLAALRLWQKAYDATDGIVVVGEDQYDALCEVAADHGGPLTVGDIDTFIERIQFDAEARDMGVVVEIGGGVLQDVHGVADYTLLDWDNLLGDGVADDEIADQWARFSSKVQAFVKRERPDEYKKIQAALRRSKKAS